MPRFQRPDPHDPDIDIPEWAPAYLEAFSRLIAAHSPAEKDAARTDMQEILQANGVTKEQLGELLAVDPG